MTTQRTIVRLERLIWVLIYGGLLTLVLGLSLQRSTEGGLGWTLVILGGIVAAAGAVLVWVRSRLRADS